ncbi:hypothetical protein [Vineibacter terrae]|uniref:hypothetical protein n=1 Tax=Vineibacter terrae TaxID=2586908 RepID=UPI002E348514|nr:hypothetical protein [Vineibacter terrae]HEX2885347.1 hypothetical protein [Vineibacter terrae]
MVHPANGSLILKEESWPQEAMWILTEFLMSDEGAQRGNVTPRFIIARDQKILLTATGNNGWKDTIWPRIQALTGTAA